MHVSDESLTSISLSVSAQLCCWSQSVYESTKRWNLFLKRCFEAQILSAPITLFSVFAVQLCCPLQAAQFTARLKKKKKASQMHPDGCQ